MARVLLLAIDPPFLPWNRDDVKALQVQEQS